MSNRCVVCDKKVCFKHIECDICGKTVPREEIHWKGFTAICLECDNDSDADDKSE